MPAIANLVHETSTGTGTGNLTLSAVNGKQSFNTAFGNGSTQNVFYYFISNRGAAEYEYGTGHMSDATTLVRDTVIESTNSDNAVNFSAGTKDVTNALSSQAFAGQMPATTTNDSASAGNVGEFVTASLASGSATSLTTATEKTVTSISLTAGDWDVTGHVYFTYGATTNFTQIAGYVSLVDNTADVTPGRFWVLRYPSAGQVNTGSNVGGFHASSRISVSSTTTVYLIARADFTVSTANAYGVISARRVR